MLLTDEELLGVVQDIYPLAKHNVDIRLTRAVAEAQLSKVLKAGYKLSPVKICEGCPDRFEDCVKLADDQSLPISLATDEAYYGGKPSTDQLVMLKAGWRKVE